MSTSSLIGLASLVSLVLLDQRNGLLAAVGDALPTALAFCLLALTAGFILGALARLSSQDRFTLLIEFSTRNVGLVAIIGTLVLGDMKLVLFAVLVFPVELPVVLVLIALRGHG